jgi:hypothetical protein
LGKEYKRVEIQEKLNRVGKDQFLHPGRVKLVFLVCGKMDRELTRLTSFQKTGDKGEEGLHQII